MSCYTPEPEDKSSETVSPVTDLQSDSLAEDDKSNVNGTENGVSSTDKLSQKGSKTSKAPGSANMSEEERRNLAQFQQSCVTNIQQLDENLGNIYEPVKRDLGELTD